MCLWRAAKGLAVAESSGSTEMMLAAAAQLGCTSIATMAHYYSANECLLCLPLQHDRYALAALCRAQRSRVWPIKRHEGIGRAQFHRNTRLLYRKSWLLNNELEADSASPLDKDIVLDTVLGFIGRGDYLYAGAVSRRWNGRYIKLCYHITTWRQQKLCTTYGSAVMTTARLQLALRSKLKIANLQEYPCALAQKVAQRSLEPQGVLTLARLHGMKWTEYFTLGAVRTNKLELLQWLVECGCPISYADALDVAVYFDHVEILAWTRSTKAVTWGQPLLQRSLELAGRAGSVHAAAWLRSQGAKWPTSFVTVDTSPNRASGNEYWLLSAVKWALANGCTWGNWRCQDLAPEHIFGTVSEGFGGAARMTLPNKKRDKTVYELFAWAHENGCPCTCEDPAAAAAALAQVAAGVAAAPGAA
jgi:hypothetical protein